MAYHVKSFSRNALIDAATVLGFFGFLIAGVLTMFNKKLLIPLLPTDAFVGMAMVLLAGIILVNRMSSNR